MLKPNPGWKPRYNIPLAYGELNLFKKIINDPLVNEDSIDKHLFIAFEDSQQLASVEKFMKERNYLYKGSYKTNSFDAFPDSVSYQTSFFVMTQSAGLGDLTPFEGKPYTMAPVDSVVLPPTSMKFDNINYLYMKNGNIIWEVTNQTQLIYSQLSYRLVNPANADIISSGTIYDLNPGETKSTTSSLVGKTIPGIFNAEVSYSSPGGNIIINLKDSLVSNFTLSNLQAEYGNAIIPSSQIGADTSIVIDDTVYNSRLTLMTLRNGTISLKLSNYFHMPVNPVFIFPSIKKISNDAILSIQVSLPSYSGTGSPKTKSKSVDLSNYYMDFRGPNQNSYNLFSSEANLNLSSNNVYVDFDIKDSIYYELELKNLNPVILRGFIGKQSFDFNGDIPFQNAMFDKINSGTILFEKAKISLEFQNSIGVKMQPEIKSFYSVNSRDTTKIVELEPKPKLKMVESALDIQSGNNPFTPVLYQDSISTFQNNNIADIFANFPKKMVINISTTINPEPDAPDKLDNFIYTKSDLTGKFIIEFPLSLIMKDVYIRDTVAFNLSKAKSLSGGGEDTSGLKIPALDSFGISEGNIRIVLANQFPLDVELKLYLMDKNYTIVDSLHRETITVKSGIVDKKFNKVLPPGSKSSIVYKIDQSLANALNKTRYVNAVMKLNTDKNNPDRHVRIYGDYKLGFSLIGDFKFDLAKKFQ